MSEKIVNRLRRYLTALESFAAEGVESLSSWQLAEKVGVNAALIRKDLSRFGAFGTPSYGYRVDSLHDSLRKILRVDRSHSIIWIGASCYREQRAAAEKLASHGCRVRAVFDTEPSQIGSAIGEHVVLPVDQLPAVVARNGVRAAALAVSGPQAQSIAEALVDAGARAILNLSGEILVLPDSVRVTNFDLVGEMIELCYYCQS